MDILKLRAWDEINKVYLIHYKQENYNHVSLVFKINEELKKDYWPVKSITLELATGLRDNKGRDVYEGDILMDTKNPKRKILIGFCVREGFKKLNPTSRRPIDDGVSLFETGINEHFIIISNIHEEEGDAL